MPYDKAHRGTALVEAAVFEPAELEEAGDRQDRGAENPAVGEEPTPLLRCDVHRRVEQMRDDAEPSPSEQIPGGQQRNKPGAIGPGVGEAMEAAE